VCAWCIVVLCRPVLCRTVRTFPCAVPLCAYSPGPCRPVPCALRRAALCLQHYTVQPCTNTNIALYGCETTHERLSLKVTYSVGNIFFPNHTITQPKKSLIESGDGVWCASKQRKFTGIKCRGIFASSTGRNGAVLLRRQRWH
jgi:hypothetical protein